MDRQIVYPGQIPLETDFLSAQRFTLQALGEMLRGVLGVNTVAQGMSVVPTVPASLAVQVLPGSIYALANLDTTDYGSLEADAIHQTIKQGILLDTINLTMTPPGTAGQAIAYLIQAAFNEVDGDPVVLPYFNSSDPSQPYEGPGDAGTADNTTRRGKVIVSAKPGIAAAAGSQVPPSPDAGYVPLCIVTVAQGATQLTGANIALAENTAYLPSALTDVPSNMRNGTWDFGLDVGVANALKVALYPRPTAMVAGMKFTVKVAATNTGPATVSLKDRNGNWMTPVPIIKAGGAGALVGGELVVGYFADLRFDGTSCQLLNSAAGTGGGATGEANDGVNIGGGIEVYKDKSGVHLEFRTLKSEDGSVNIATDGDAVNLQISGALFPFYPEVETVDGTLAITATTGQIVVNPTQTWVWRGCRRYSTDNIAAAARTFTTAINKTYHLRWSPTNGFVLKDLADAGYNPTTATEDNAGFDTSFDDMLVARVITNASNVPTVTPLVNKARLSATNEVIVGNTSDPTQAAETAPSNITIGTTVTLNWARRAHVAMSSVSSITAADFNDHITASLGAQLAFGVASKTRYGFFLFYIRSQNTQQGWVRYEAWNG